MPGFEEKTQIDSLSVKTHKSGHQSSPLLKFFCLFLSIYLCHTKVIKWSCLFREFIWGSKVQMTQYILCNLSNTILIAVMPLMPGEIFELVLKRCSGLSFRVISEAKHKIFLLFWCVHGRKNHITDRNESFDF